MATIRKHYYSERGMINCLTDWIEECSLDDLNKFFKLLYGQSDKTIAIDENAEIDIYTEFEFNDFGAPDLIITLNKEEIFFVEAKISGFIKSASENLTEKRTEVEFINNASKIDVQLLLRKRFISAETINEDTDNEFISQEEPQYKGNKKNRVLKKKSLVKWANKDIRNKGDNYHYIALVLDDKDDHDKDIYDLYYGHLEKYVINKDDFVLLTWNKLLEVVKSDEMKEAWEFTFGDGTFPINAKEEDNG